MSQTQQVTFHDFVLEIRQWKKYVNDKIERLESQHQQLRVEQSTVDETLNNVRDEVTHQLAEMAGQLSETNNMIEELLAGLPDEADEDEGDDIVVQQELEDFAQDSDSPIMFLGEVDD